MLPFSVQENKNINLTLNNVEIYQYQSTDLFLSYLIENILQDIRLPVVIKKQQLMDVSKITLLITASAIV